MSYWEDPAWQRHNELMARHQASRHEPGKPALTADERPACSGWSLAYVADAVQVTLAVPGLGALVLRMREGAVDGKLDWLDCRLTAR